MGGVGRECEVQIEWDSGRNERGGLEREWDSDRREEKDR